MREQLIEFLNSKYYYQGRGANIGVWATFPNRTDTTGSQWIEYTKTISGKQSGYGSIWIYEEGEWGFNIKIEMYIPSYAELATVFEGWIKDVEGLTFILDAVGLPFVK